MLFLFLYYIRVIESSYFFFCDIFKVICPPPKKSNIIVDKFINFHRVAKTL